MKFPTMHTPPGTAERAEEKRKAAEQLKIRGADVKCKPPRSVMCQGGSRKLVTTWELPADTKGITGWNVYSPDENTRYAHVEGLSNRRCDVAVSPNPAATPLAVPVFVSSCGPSGVNESQKTQGSGTPTAEATAPVDPTPPVASSGGGGAGDTPYYNRRYQ